MDLRIVKTRRAIREAFLQLRATTKLEQVKVKDICDLAFINKTTFYKHYQDVFLLSEELEMELANRVWEDFALKGELLTDPEGFLADMRAAMEKHLPEIRQVYQGRMNVYFSQMETRLITLYTASARTDLDQILLIFVLAGVMRAFRELRVEGKFGKDVLLQGVVTLIRSLPVQMDRQNQGQAAPKLK